uniref:Uncharacterized protein n=1 Tax=Salix viminalis TaxID=40686 RepID=A0A6N2KUF3_SALVM
MRVATQGLGVEKEKAYKMRERTNKIRGATLGIPRRSTIQVLLLLKKSSDGIQCIIAWMIAPISTTMKVISKHPLTCNNKGRLLGVDF